MSRLSRLMILLPDKMLSEIDLYRRYAPDLPTRTEAIRRLIGEALEAHDERAHEGDAFGRALRNSRGFAVV